MSRDDLDALRARVAAQQGKEPHQAGALLKPGAVFEIEDRFVWFRDATMNKERTEHDARRVIVLQAQHLLFRGPPDSVMVVPCTSVKSGRKPGSTEVSLDGERGFSKESFAIAHLVMPVGKAHFHEGKWKAQLSPEAYGRVRGAVGRCLAMGTKPTP